ncbi:hypothetical protein [Actinokineospora pegani]|uniref:hypothetical protein n=1 Tax=Actinokineospora pegani TaxID=2654637 RepID=UPI0012E9ACCD|nr:hypothetical protein [Actinokineospora pegani]
MAQANSILVTTQVKDVATAHRKAIAAILRAAGQGMFTAAEAESLVGRVRARLAVLEGRNSTLSDEGA